MAIKLRSLLCLCVCVLVKIKAKYVCVFVLFLFFIRLAHIEIKCYKIQLASNEKKS